MLPYFSPTPHYLHHTFLCPTHYHYFCPPCHSTFTLLSVVPYSLFYPHILPPLLPADIIPRLPFLTTGPSALDLPTLLPLPTLQYQPHGAISALGLTHSVTCCLAVPRLPTLPPTLACTFPLRPLYLVGPLHTHCHATFLSSIPPSALHAPPYLWDRHLGTTHTHTLPTHVGLGPWTGLPLTPCLGLHTPPYGPAFQLPLYLPACHTCWSWSACHSNITLDLTGTLHTPRLTTLYLHTLYFTFTHTQHYIPLWDIGHTLTFTTAFFATVLHTLPHIHMGHY